MLADVLAIVKITPNSATPPRLRAKLSSLKSDDAARFVPGNDVQASQKPCSALIAEPQLGQNGSANVDSSPSAGCPLSSSRKRSAKWRAALPIAWVCRHVATKWRQSTSSRAEAPPFSFACKVNSGERYHVLQPVSVVLRGPFPAS